MMSSIMFSSVSKSPDLVSCGAFATFRMREPKLHSSLVAMWIISIDEVFGGSIWFEYWYAQHIMLWKDFWVYNNQPSIVAPFLAEIAHSTWCCSFGQTNILGESADRWQHMLSKIRVGVRRVYFLFCWALKRENEGDHKEEREEEGRRGRDRGRVATLPENNQVLLWRWNILWTMMWENALTRENQRGSVKHQALEPERRKQAEIRLLLGNWWKAVIRVKWKCDNLTPSPTRFKWKSLI